jgi:hypothetical protein
MIVFYSYLVKSTKFWVKPFMQGHGLSMRNFRRDQEHLADYAASALTHKQMRTTSNYRCYPLLYHLSATISLDCLRRVVAKTFKSSLQDLLHER